jgi:hypothetical protein
MVAIAGQAEMKKSGIPVSGVKLDKNGKLVKAPKFASVADKLKRQSSKKVRVVKK